MQQWFFKNIIRHLKHEYKLQERLLWDPKTCSFINISTLFTFQHWSGLPVQYLLYTIYETAEMGKKQKYC
jgi:hypothetical protein